MNDHPSEAPEVAEARAYLTGAAGRPVGTLPPTVLMRELAETRRLLAVLVVNAPTGAQREILAACDEILLGDIRQAESGLDSIPAEDRAEIEADDDLEPYCTTCGEWAGIFLGLEGWRHFRGDPSAGGVRTLYEADHEAVIGWIRPPGMALSPAGMEIEDLPAGAGLGGPGPVTGASMREIFRMDAPPEPHDPVLPGLGGRNCMVCGLGKDAAAHTGGLAADGAGQ